MVRGLCTHTSGVGSLGEDGPKAPIVLGTNTRRPCSVAMSNMLWKPTKRERLCIRVCVKVALNAVAAYPYNLSWSVLSSVFSQ